MNISNFSQLYEHAINDRPFVGVFLSGHLAVEYLLRKIVVIHDPSKAKLAGNVTHAKLIELVAATGIINSAQTEVLTQINRMRNQFAHQITYQPSIEDLKVLYRSAAKAFSDMTDGIAQGLEALEKCTELGDLDDYAIPELFVQICYDLHGAYHNLGGDAEEF